MPSVKTLGPICHYMGREPLPPPAPPRKSADARFLESVFGGHYYDIDIAPGVTVSIQVANRALGDESPQPGEGSHA